MKKKIVLPQKPVLCPLPLINSTTLFSYGAWNNAFDYALNQILCTKHKQPNQDITVTFKDLYFMKVMGDEERAKLPLENSVLKLGRHERSEIENHDRDDEWSYSIDTGKFGLRIYRFHNAICLSVNGSSHLNRLDVKKGEFRKPPLRVTTSVEEFLGFIEAVEKLFLQTGGTEQVRAFITVQHRFFDIEVAVLHERLSEGKEVSLGYNRELPTISRRIFLQQGKVPKPRCSIRFK